MKPYSQTTISRATQIAHIMETFDFARVHEVMTKLDWRWHGKGVPSIAALRTTAADLLSHLGEKSPYCSTGGFTATIDAWGGYNLAFSITETSGNTDTL